MKFTEYLTLQSLSKGTIDQYKLFYKLYQREHPGEITQDKLNHFIINHNYPLTRFFLQHLIRYKGKKELDIPKIRGRKGSKLLQYLDEESIKELIASLNPLEYYDFRTILIITLLFEGGLRISELIGLRPSDIDFNDNSMKVTGKGNKERLAYFSEKTKALLTHYLKFVDNDNLLFDITRQRAFTIIKKAGKKINKNIHPHIFRHSCGTFMREKGFDLQEIGSYLGHARLETTSIYAHIDRKKMVNKLKNIRD